ncbi:hypothetical protein Vretimale_1774 [Volvox reticuliferus]|uniref:Uncharacterized protein n=1 Tax=Volvox reticuliferus TaxID=1737510 RepID=A0A8J4FV48_9CHLO|nr:hypothetical protein Vretifemale_15353 [Volvox reticuliferus]GIL95835.1 hypothetical protein Vretimale_1774 [Volvox reticuliferus]
MPSPVHMPVADIGCMTSRIDLRDAIINGQAQKHRDDCCTPGKASGTACTSHRSKMVQMTLPALLSPIATPATAINPVAPHTSTYMPHKPSKRRLNLSSPPKPHRKSVTHDCKAVVKGHRAAQAKSAAAQIPTRTACGFCVEPDPDGLGPLRNASAEVMANATSHSSGTVDSTFSVAAEAVGVAITHSELNSIDDGTMAAEGHWRLSVHARRPVRENLLLNDKREGGREHNGDEQWQLTGANQPGQESLERGKQRGNGSSTPSAAVATASGVCTDRPVRKAAAKARQRIMMDLKLDKKVGPVSGPLRLHAGNCVNTITVDAAANAAAAAGNGTGTVSWHGSSSMASESSGWSPEIHINVSTQHKALVDGADEGDAGGDSCAADKAGRRPMGVIPGKAEIILDTDSEDSGDLEGYVSAASIDDDEHVDDDAEIGPEADRSRGTVLYGTRTAATSGHSSGAHADRSGHALHQQQQLRPALPGWDPRRPGYVELSKAVEYRQACRRDVVERPEDLPRCWGVGLLGDNLVVCNTVLHGSVAVIFQEARKAALQGRLWELQDEVLVQLENDDERLTSKQAKALTHQFEERLRKAAAEHMAASAQPWRGGAARKDWRSLAHAEILENLPELIPPSGKVETVILGEDESHPWEDVPAMTGQASLRVRPGSNLAPGEFIGLYSAEAWLHPEWQAQILANPMDNWDDTEYPCPYRFSAIRKHYFGRYAADCCLPEKLFEHLDQLDIQDERLRTQLQEEPENCGKMFLTSARLGCMMSAANDPRRNLRAMCEAEADFREGGPNAVVIAAVILGILPVLVMVATSHIPGGQHIMYSYGPAYWNLHEEEQSVCRDLEAVWNELRKARAWESRRQQCRDLKCRLTTLTHQWEETQAELKVERESRLAAEELAAKERARCMEMEEELRALRAMLHGGHAERKPQPTPPYGYATPLTSLGDLNSQGTSITANVAEPAVGGAIKSGAAAGADDATGTPRMVIHSSSESHGKVLGALGSPLGKRTRADTTSTTVEAEGTSGKAGGVAPRGNDGDFSGVDSARRALAGFMACGPSVTSTTTVVTVAEAGGEATTDARRYSRLSLRREGKAMLGDQGAALDATNARISNAAAAAQGFIQNPQRQLILDVGGSSPGVSAGPVGQDPRYGAGSAADGVAGNCINSNPHHGAGAPQGTWDRFVVAIAQQLPPSPGSQRKQEEQPPPLTLSPRPPLLPQKPRQHEQNDGQKDGKKSTRLSYRLKERQQLQKPSVSSRHLHQQPAPVVDLVSDDDEVD